MQSVAAQLSEDSVVNKFFVDQKSTRCFFFLLLLPADKLIRIKV